VTSVCRRNRVSGLQGKGKERNPKTSPLGFLPHRQALRQSDSPGVSVRSVCDCIVLTEGGVDIVLWRREGRTDGDAAERARLIEGRAGSSHWCDAGERHDRPPWVSIDPSIL